MNNQKVDFEENDDSFDIKQAFSTIKTYSKSIIAITTLIVVLSVVSAYFKPQMYSSSALLQISSDNRARSSDPMMQAFGYEQTDFDNEIRVLSSRYLIAKALQNLDIGTRYFVTEDLKTSELYKESPFVVNVSFMDYHLLGKKIAIRPIDDNMYELSYEPETKWNLKGLKAIFFPPTVQQIKYKGIHKFGEDASTPFFKITVTKIHELTEKTYHFSYVENEDMDMFIQSNISIEQTSKYGSNILVRFHDTVPLRAKEIVSAVVDAYMKDEIEQKRASAKKSLEFIDKQLEAINETLNKSEVTLQKYKQSNALVDLPSKVQTTSSQLEALKTEWGNISSEESILENLKDFIERNNDLSGLTLQSIKLTSDNLNTMILEYQAAETRRKTMLIELTDIHPDVLKLNEEIFNLRKNIQETIIQSIQAIKQRKLYLDKAIEDAKTSMYELPEQERKLGVLTRNFSVNENIYSFLLQRRAETAILESSTLSRTRIIDKASVPLLPYAPNKTKFILTGALFGLVLGLIVAFLRAYINDVIKDIDELERLVSLPVFGKIPENKKRVVSVAYEEAFRELRTNLEFVKSDKESKSILVTSAISGEGKSTTIKNLADMLVKLNRKVIVLDFDLRRPSLHKYFNDIANNTGLSLVLSGQCSLQESIQRTKENINIISAGPVPPNPSELIMSDAADILFKTLSSNYDYILIDSPPYSVVTDAAILMKKADITLFSVMANFSKRDAVKEINKIVKQYEMKSAGIVFNGIRLNKKESHGYGYYGKE